MPSRVSFNPQKATEVGAYLAARAATYCGLATDAAGMTSRWQNARVLTVIHA